jgi:hypothetical protein
MGGGLLIELALLIPAVEVRSRSNERTRSDKPSSSSSSSRLGRQQGRQPQESFHLKKVEKRVAATATITNDPRTMRKMKGAERVNGLEGSEVAAGAAEEVVAADEVDEDETDTDEEDEGAEEDMRTFGIVLVGFVDVD